MTAAIADCSCCVSIAAFSKGRAREVNSFFSLFWESRISGVVDSREAFDDRKYK